LKVYQEQKAWLFFKGSKMISKKDKMSGYINLSLSIAVVCLALMLYFSSTGYGDIILGNWESADSNDGWIPAKNGTPPEDANVIFTPGSDVGVTLGHGSLKVAAPILPGTTADSYWRLQWLASPMDLTDAQLQFDLTMVASEWSGEWTKVAAKVAINSDGPSGWKEYGPDVPDDKITVINRDTGETITSSPCEWGNWQGDVNKTFTVNVSGYDATGATYMGIAISVQNPANGAGYFYFDNIRLLTPDMTVSKGKVTAGKTQYLEDGDYNNMKDTFTVSGTVVLPPDVNDINSVVVAITSTTDDYLAFTETLTDFNATVVNAKGKYTHSAKVIKGQAGKITSMKLDFRKGTFSITAKNVDLTGLSCPFQIKFTMGSYELKGNAYETVVNGAKKTIPTRLMRMYDDKLVVTKAKVKNSTKASSDSLSVKGEVAVEDFTTSEPNLYAEDVNIIWIDKDDTNNVQTFKIPAGSFKIPKKGRAYKCSKINPEITPVAEPNTFIAATIDLDKCTFAVSITKADVSDEAATGDVQFGLRFADFNEIYDVNLALGH
jgi:hypothetical protein